MSILTRKYPFPQSSHWLRDSIIDSAIVFLILFLLQPFGFNMYQGNKLLLALLFGAVTFGCCLLFGQVHKPIYRRVATWRIWHQAVTVLLLILLVSIGNYLVCSVVFDFSITFSSFLLFLYWTLIIGVIVTVCSISLSYYRHLRNQLETLLDKTTEQQTDISVTIHDTNVRGNDLQLPINDLLYIEAQKNNVAVSYMKEGKIITT